PLPPAASPIHSQGDPPKVTRNALPGAQAVRRAHSKNRPHQPIQETARMARKTTKAAASKARNGTRAKSGCTRVETQPFRSSKAERGGMIAGLRKAGKGRSKVTAANTDNTTSKTMARTICLSQDVERAVCTPRTALVYKDDQGKGRIKVAVELAADKDGQDTVIKMETRHYKGVCDNMRNVVRELPGGGARCSVCNFHFKKKENSKTHDFCGAEGHLKCFMCSTVCTTVANVRKHAIAAKHVVSGLVLEALARKVALGEVTGN
ncbi:hypothetical protein DFJ74DRAFT_720585, partial [Hyaloraphidium curvatum]